MKRTLVVAGIITAISAAGLAGAGMASAATDTSTRTDPFSSLVDALSSKFNLNKTDVQAVFDTQKSQMQAEREQEAKDQIAQLVTDGKLTQTQADKINAKRTDLQVAREAKRASGETMTSAERQAERETHKAELDIWLKDNGIDSQYAYLLFGGGHGHGGPGGMHRG